MRKGRWKKKLLCAALSFAMMTGIVADVPGVARQTVMAAATTQVTGGQTAPVQMAQITSNPGSGAKGGSVSYQTIVSHDYDEIKAALESDGDYHVRLDGDVTKALGRIIHASDSAGLFITVDVLTLGLAEILFEDDDWRPTFVSEDGKENGGGYKNGGQPRGHSALW